MYYQSFSIKNFKGISEVNIDLSRNRILSLVGLNESGKSTILTAINLFYRLVKGEEISEVELNSFRPKGIDFSGEIEITGNLQLEPEDKDKLKKFLEGIDPNAKLKFPDSYSYSKKFIFKLHKYIETKNTSGLHIINEATSKSLYEENNDLWSKLLRYLKENLIPEVLFYEDFIFDIPEKIYFVVSGELTPEQNTPKNQQWQLVLNDVLKAVNPEFSSFQEDIVSIWNSDNDTATNRLSSMEGQLNNKITSGWKQLFQLPGKKTRNQSLNFKEIKLSTNSDGVTLQISFKVKTDAEKEFLINERSKGCKWFFSFLLFTEFRKNRTKNILFLLDEPASNLHSSAQLKIMDAIQDLSSGSMVVYSTHSHHLINPKWLSGSYVIINEVISEAQLQGNMTFNEGAKITAEKYFSYIGKGLGSVKSSYYQPILDRLDYKPSNIEPIPDIVITEGKNDWYAFKYFSEIVLKDTFDFHFYPGPGCDQHWDIIRLYLSWGKKFLLILDGDSAGVRAKNLYIKEFQEFLQDKIFTLNDIFGQSWTTEDLITDTDKELICDKAFGKGKYASVSSNPSQLKLALNLAINQLLIQGVAIKISKTTQKNFKTLFDFIKSHR